MARYLRGANLIAREQDGAAQYYLFNAHGDVTQRLDALGNLLKNYRYDAFGNEENPEPLDVNPFRYCGEYFDRETGDYYLRARSYDPRTGRFTAEDSTRSAEISLPGDKKAVDPLSLNIYTYCHNDPIKYVDVTGNFALSAAALALLISMGVGAGIGALIGGGFNIAVQGFTKGWDNINWKEVGINAGAGAGTGALSGSGIGMPIVMALDAIIGAGAYAGTQKVNGEEIDPLAMAVSAGLSAFAGWIGGNGKVVLDDLNDVLSHAKLSEMMGDRFVKEIALFNIEKIISGSVLSSGIRTFAGNMITLGQESLVKFGGKISDWLQDLLDNLGGLFNQPRRRDREFQERRERNARRTA